MTRAFYQIGGYGSGDAFPLPVEAFRAPTTNDKISPDGSPYVVGQGWYNKTTATAYFYEGNGVWESGSGSPIVQITTDSGVAVPSAGNINLLGTAAAGLSFSGSGSTVTGNIAAASTTQRGTLETSTDAESVTGTSTVVAVTPASLTARLAAPGPIGGTTPGSGAFTTVSATTTVTAGTTVTATLGAITATNGNFVASTAGTGVLLNSASASGVAASPVVVNGRSGRATFTSVSIAAAADLTLTITNSSITASTTIVLMDMSGATTGSALSIKSKTASAGSLAIVVTNGTGATTTTADIQVDFVVVNA